MGTVKSPFTPNVDIMPPNQSTSFQEADGALSGELEHVEVGSFNLSDEIAKISDSEVQLDACDQKFIDNISWDTNSQSSDEDGDHDAYAAKEE